MSARIVIGEHEPDLLMYYRVVATRLGHQVLALATTGLELIARCTGPS